MMELFPVALLAGGFATRLRPITETIPKSLIEVAERPFIHHQLALLRRRGIKRVVICAGHLGEMIRDEVGAGSAFGLEIDYSFDGPTLLGTGGALLRARDLLGETFFVLYGDSYLECDYAGVQQAFLDSGKPALMTVYKNDGHYDTSNVVFRSGRIVVYDKTQRLPEMRWIDYGLGVLSGGAVERIPPGIPFDLAALYSDLVEEGKLAGYEVRERFYEIGSFAGLAELSARLKRDI